MQRQHISAYEVVWYDDQFLTEPIERIFSADYWRAQQRITGQAQGRGTTWFVQTAQGEAALRHYRRGGLLGKLIQDQYLFTGWENTRSCREFLLLQHLQQQGVHVPRPLAARAVKTGVFYRADLITGKIPAAQDLVGILTSRTLSTNEYQRIGAEIALLHRAQVNHTDLNIHNILLDADGQVWIIDFDKCRQETGNGWQQANLDRLLRSFRKEKIKRAIQWQDSDFHALLAGYRGATD